MTSEEIKGQPSANYMHDTFWLKEIAYQLAVMNERNRTLENINSIVNSILDGPQKGQNQ